MDRFEFPPSPNSIGQRTCPGNFVAPLLFPKSLRIFCFLILTFPFSASAQTTNAAPLAPPADPTTPPVAQPAFLAPPGSETNAPPATATGSPVAPVLVPSPATARFDSALASYNAAQYADAVTAFSDFITAFPQDRHREEALYRLAESYRNLGRTDDALAAYTFQTQAYPDGLLRNNAELHRGAILYDKQNFTDAIPALQHVADKGDEPLKQPAKYLLARSLLSTQKEADARALFQSLLDQNPPGKFAAPSAQTLAELDDTQEHYAEAFPLWQKVLDLATETPVKATAAARGGWSALQAKQPDIAEKLFQTARQFDPGGEPRKVANTGLLRLFFQQKRYADWVALDTAEQDHLLDSARSEILYDLGHAQFSLKHWPQAVAGFDQYLAANASPDIAVSAAYERFLAVTQIDRTKTPAEAEAYLKAWPKSPFAARVLLLQAQELSREKHYAAALPIWEGLATEAGGADWPHSEIMLEIARAHDELNQFPQAATAYRNYLDDAGTHPSPSPPHLLAVEARLALCLEKSDQLIAATDAWRTVLSLAPPGSPERQTALESLGLIYARGGPAQETAMVTTFRALLESFPHSPLRALAAFSVGDSLFKNRDYRGSEPLLLNARNWDAKTWMQPATQRLVLGAYGLKDADKTTSYLGEYDTLPLPTDAQARIAARLPAALFYWLAETARQAGKWDEAEIDYARVTQHPEPGELLAGAWWQLGEVRSRRAEWTAAVASYKKYRDLKPEAQDATVVLLALGRAELGANDTGAAKKLGDQALLQEPEGPRSAQARMLLGETAFASHEYAEAARTFATLAVLFDDPKITPQAMARAADSFDQAGDATSATNWRTKLEKKYPGFQAVPYL